MCTCFIYELMYVPVNDFKISEYRLAHTRKKDREWEQKMGEITNLKPTQCDDVTLFNASRICLA